MTTATVIGKKLSFTIFLPLAMIIILLMPLQASVPAGGPAALDDALYFSLTPANTLPKSPSSLLVQSPSYINVPAGSSLTVLLIKGNKLVSTSTLVFQQALFNERLLPPVPIASFVPPGSQGNSGQPLPGATLTAGQADLADLVNFPSQYALQWVLSKGVMGTPGRAIATGSPVGYVDLKLASVSAATAIGDQKPGSVLFFSRYISNAGNPQAENTKINLTNTNVALSTYVRLFLVNGSTCGVDTVDICLQPQQTFSFLMSDVDPGVKGYMVAVATNAAGQPTQFNWLTGNVVIRQASTGSGGSYSSVINALALARRLDGAVPNVNGSAEMIFDDLNYDRLPGQLAFDGIQSQLNGLNATVLSLYRPLPDLAGVAAGTSVRLTASSLNAASQVQTSNGTLSVACYNEFPVSNIRLSPVTMAQLLPAGATAWFSLSSNDLVPLFGVVMNTGEFNSGSNARSLTFAAEYRIKVPVSPVTCPQ